MIDRANDEDTGRTHELLGNIDDIFRDILNDISVHALANYNSRKQSERISGIVVI